MCCRLTAGRSPFDRGKRGFESFQHSMQKYLVDFEHDNLNFQLYFDTFNIGVGADFSINRWIGDGIGLSFKLHLIVLEVYLDLAYYFKENCDC